MKMPETYLITEDNKVFQVVEGALVPSSREAYQGKTVLDATEHLLVVMP